MRFSSAHFKYEDLILAVGTRNQYAWRKAVPLSQTFFAIAIFS